SRDPLPTPALLRQPASGWALSQWLHAGMAGLSRPGTAWGLIPDRTGAAMRPAQVELLAPDLVTVTVMPEGPIVYRYKGAEVDRDQLWHCRAFVYPGQPAGLSPVEH